MSLQLFFRSWYKSCNWNSQHSDLVPPPALWLQCSFNRVFWLISEGEISVSSVSQIESCSVFPHAVTDTASVTSGLFRVKCNTAASVAFCFAPGFIFHLYWLWSWGQMEMGLVKASIFFVFISMLMSRQHCCSWSWRETTVSCSRKQTVYFKLIAQWGAVERLGTAAILPVGDSSLSNLSSEKKDYCIFRHTRHTSLSVACVQICQIKWKNP